MVIGDSPWIRRGKRPAVRVRVPLHTARRHMSARTALLTLARRAGKAPVRVSRRNMSGGSIEEEIGAHPSRAPSRLIERGY